MAHTFAPELAFQVLDMAHHVFPDSAAAQGSRPGEDHARELEQVMLARVFKGHPLAGRPARHHGPTLGIDAES